MKEGIHPEYVESTEQQGEALAKISTGLVQLHSRHYGKGPTRAKTGKAVRGRVVCSLNLTLSDMVV